MSEVGWDRMWGVFHRALEVEPGARDAWLTNACAGDETLCTAVARLLAGHEDAPSFLDQPAALGPWLEADVDPIGEAIGPFFIEELLGEGGMGVVYRARQDEPIRRHVALKLIQVGLATREVIARFESERQALAALDHPNIVKVLDAGATKDGRPFFVMELFKGVAITDYCDQNRLSVQQRLELFMPVCRAVHHAHQKGIIHRDLKPSNVVVAEQDGEPVPKVIDFGVARAVDRTERRETALTQHGGLIGTPEYMSPEQADMASDVDIRTDVYALGVLLYQLLTGRLPFEARSLRRGTPERLEQILRGETPPAPSQRVSRLGGEAGTVAERRTTTPESLRRALRGDLDWVVMAAVEADRDRRYGTASELADELQRHLRDQPVLAGPPGLGYQVEKFVKRHRLGVGAAATAVLLLIGFSVFISWQAVQLRRALSQGEREARTAEEVTAFLIDLFETSDPGEARGERIAVDQVLDRGARRIATELDGQPRIQARMLDAIGEIYINLGLFPEAEEVLERGMALRSETLGEQHSEVAESHDRLALLRQWQGDLTLAEGHARSALDLRRIAFGEAGAEVAQSLLRLGTVLRHAGRYEEAESVLRESVARWQEAAPEEDPEAGYPMNTLGITLQRRGMLEEAEQTLRRAIDIGQRNEPEGHLDIGTRKMNLASVLSDLGRDAEAEALLQEALVNRRRIYGEDHIEVAICMNNLARVRQRLGDHAGAESLFRAVLDMSDRLGWKDRNEIAVAMLNLGVLLRQGGRYEEAEALYRDGLAIQQRRLGADHPTVGIAHHNLGALLRRLDRFDEAEAELRRAVDIQREALRDGHWHVARSEAVLGRVLVAAGRHEEAEHILRKAEMAFVDELPPGHRRILHARLYLGQSLTGQRRFEDAEPLLLEAFEGLTADRGPGDESTLEALESLVSLYEAWERPEEAGRFRTQRRSADASGP